MKKIVPLAVAAVLAAPAAFAGTAAAPIIEAPVAAPAPAPQPIIDWTGPYAGASLGFARTDWDFDVFQEQDDDLWGIAGHVGYNMDMGNWVVGGEFNLAPGFDQEAAGREINWGAAARVKAGPKFGPGGSTWGFGTLGVTHVSHDAIGGGDSQSSNGWLVGIGASHMVQQNMFITGEINHSRSSGDLDFRSTGVSLGVSFRF